MVSYPTVSEIDLGQLFQPRMLRWWNGIHGRLKIFCPYGLVGSNPTRSTFAPIDERSKSLPFQGRGHGFESRWGYLIAKIQSPNNTTGHCHNQVPDGLTLRRERGDTNLTMIPPRFANTSLQEVITMEQIIFVLISFSVLGYLIWKDLTNK